MTRKEFYKTKAWQDCRNRYFESVGGLCEKCRAKGKIKKGEIVHHSIHLDEENFQDATISLNPANLILVCRECHALEHGAHKCRYTVDEFGRCRINPDE